MLLFIALLPWPRFVRPYNLPRADGTLDCRDDSLKILASTLGGFFLSEKNVFLGISWAHYCAKVG